MINFTLARSAGRRHADGRRRWPAVLRLGLVGLVAVLAIVLAGPVATADAAPKEPGPTESFPPGPPSFMDKLKWRVWEASDAATLDIHDKHYNKKSAVQLLLARFVKRGPGEFSWRTDIPELADDYKEYKQRQGQTVEGLTKRVGKAAENVNQTKKNVDKALTRDERRQADQKLREAVTSYKYVDKKLQAAKKTRPEEVSEQAKHLEQEASKLTNKIADLERKAKDPKQTRTEAGRQSARQQIDGLRKKLAQTNTERDRLRGSDGDSDTGGTRTAPSGPKPPKGPATGGTKTPDGPGFNAKAAPKGSAITGAKAPKGPILSGSKAPKPGLQRLAQGKGSGIAAEAFGEVLGQVTAEGIARENEKLLEEALEDPAMAQRMIAEFKDSEDNSPLEDLARPFTGPEFTPGDLRDNGPKLIEVQKTIETTNATAQKSNADPLYQEARKRCGGYDTCVTEQTRKLREKNAKDITASTKAAAKSNADPSYQEARKRCGGYDTCVTEQTRKLRAEAKADTSATKKSPKTTATKAKTSDTAQKATKAPTQKRSVTLRTPL